MKQTLLLTLLSIQFFSFSQTDKTMVFDGLTREYLEYVPAIYDGSQAVPLVLALHGLGDTKENFYSVGFNYLADTANFILLTPEAVVETVYGAGTAWNSGASQYGYVLNQNVDDVGFLTALINYTKGLYNIDESRIYITGFSMGGFMANRLACEMSGEIAAIASVSGTIGNSVSCNPEFPIPVCHLHGTNDATVAYSGNNYGNDAEALVEYWRNHNQCDASPTIVNLPDYVSDGKTVDYYLYDNGLDNTTVEFYKVNNGEHEWLFYPNNDITYTIEIWKFFRKQYNLNVGIKHQIPENNISLYPNPASESVSINVKNVSSTIHHLKLYSTNGVLLKSENKVQFPYTLNIKDLPKGIYILKLDEYSQRLIVE